MDIDLSLLHSNTVNSIDISGTYNIDSSYFKGTEVIKLDNIVVDGLIMRRENDDLELEDYIECTIDGEMVIPDSISLEEVKFPFSIKYDDIIEENCKKYENTLDIFQFLWENIVLEVPLQFTKVEDLSKFHGDGWKLVSEDELISNNNPFSDLLKDFKEEE
jgi:uncharacterized metal-binding protein YceD (DUF177 family)